jgi:hypothetical protein
LSNAIENSTNANNPPGFFPAITHFTDAITALPKDVVRHFTLLKEVDAKVWKPEEMLGHLVDAALSAPLPERSQPAVPPNAEASVPMSAIQSAHGSMVNGVANSTTSNAEATGPNSVPQAEDPAEDPSNLHRRQLFFNLRVTIQDMLVAQDEKNHVIQTANEALARQLACVESSYPHIKDEISEEARCGSLSHWAYTEYRTPKTTNERPRRDAAAANTLAAAAAASQDDLPSRADRPMRANKGRHHHHADSDFDDHGHRGRHGGADTGKKPHGNTKVRKVGETNASLGFGISNGASTTNPHKKRKTEKSVAGGVAMERSLSGALGNNGPSKGGAGSPRETPAAEGRKRARGAANAPPKKKYVHFSLGILRVIADYFQERMQALPSVNHHR